MKNFIYWDTVESELLKALTEGLPLNMAKKVVTGDFKKVPVPKDNGFQNFFPAVLINIADSEIAYDNAGLMSTTQQYNFTIYYMYLDDGTYHDTDFEARRASKEICNILMNNRTLNDLYIEKSETEAGMQGLGGEVQEVLFESQISELFYQMEIPINVTSVTYSYQVKTFRT